MKTKLNLTYWVLERLHLDYERLRRLAREHLEDLKHLREYGDPQMVHITPSQINTATYAWFALEETCHFDGDKNRHFHELMEWRCLPLTRIALVSLIEAECMSPVRLSK